jgi:hypothetical protein
MRTLVALKLTAGPAAGDQADRARASDGESTTACKLAMQIRKISTHARIPSMNWASAGPQIR